MYVENQAFIDQQADIDRRAVQMRGIFSMLDSENGKTIDIGQNPEKAKGVLESAIKGTVYAGFHNGATIAGAHATAIHRYIKAHGCFPSRDLLASCHKTLENVLAHDTGNISLGGVFESAYDDYSGKETMDTTRGIIMRDRLLALTLPIWLQTISANMCTFIPGDYNQSIFYRIKRVANSSFGGYAKGDIIDWDFTGGYATLDRIELIGTGDGSTKNYSFSSQEKYGTAYPFKPKRTRVYVDHTLLSGFADNDGNLYGSITIGESTITLTGTVTYATGVVALTFSSAIPSGLEVHLGFDVDIEANPALIPSINHKMATHVLYPHESAITTEMSVQALWAMRRELGQDLDNLSMQSMRNILAADKDRKHLSQMLFAAKNVYEWERPAFDVSFDYQEHVTRVKSALLAVDSMLAKANGVAGMTGLICGTDATNLFRYLHTDFIAMSPDYHFVAQPHYVGRLWHQFELFCDPNMERNTCLCYAKGPDYGQTAFVCGDAVPALNFRHPIQQNLVQAATLWELAYRDIQPHDGQAYLAVLKMIEPSSNSGD